MPPRTRALALQVYGTTQDTVTLSFGVTCSDQNFYDAGEHVY